MANALLGYANAVLTGTLTAGSEQAGLTVGNLQSPHGSAAFAWRTAAGIETAEAGAWFACDTGNTASTWRAFCLARTNLSTAAQMRVRVGDPAAWTDATPSLSVDFTNPAGWVAPAGWTFTRTSIGTRINSSGFIETLSAGAMRFDYDPTTLVCRGLLLETARINNLIRSSEFDNSGAWSVTGITVTANGSTGPDGATSMDKLAEDTSTGEHRATQGVTVTAAAWTYSVFLKAAERTKARLQLDATISAVTSQAYVLADLSAGTVGSATLTGNFSGGSTIIESLPNGIYRIALTCTAAAAATVNVRVMVADASGSINYAGTSGSGLWAFGAQAETGGHISSYIPTTTAAVTRNADLASCSTPAGLTASEGTLAAQVTLNRLPVTSAVRTLLALDNGTSNERTILRAEGGNQARVFQTAGGTTQGSVYDGTFIQGTPAWSIATYQGLNLAVATRTTSVATGSSPVAPAAPSTLWFGQDRGGVHLFGVIAKALLFNTKLSAGQVATYASTGNTYDSTATVTYDSGQVTAGVVAGIGQAVFASPAQVTGRGCRVDLWDSTNTDNYISVPLAFLGPAWQPSINYAPESTQATKRGQQVTRTRSGATFTTPLYTERAWSIGFGAITAAEFLAQVVPADLAAADGRNCLFVPDPLSSARHADAVLGQMESTAEFGFVTLDGQRRSWRLHIAERL